MLQPRDLPDLLDVARLLRRPVVDPEGVAVRVGAATGDRIGEPVGLHQVGPLDAEHVPLTLQQPIRGLEDGGPG